MPQTEQVWYLFHWETPAHPTCPWTGLPFSWGAEIRAAVPEPAGGSRWYVSPQGKAAVWCALYCSMTINFMSVYSLSWYFSCLVDDQWVVNLESWSRIYLVCVASKELPVWFEAKWVPYFGRDLDRRSAPGYQWGVLFQLQQLWQLGYGRTTFHGSTSVSWSCLHYPAGVLHR